MSINAIKKSAVAGTAALALLLTACAEQETDPVGDDTAATTTSSEAAETDAATGAEAVALEAGVVRAKGTDVGMTAIFGTLSNTSDEDVQIVGVDTDLEEGRYEIHEVVDGVMQEKEEPLNIPAGQEHALEPGGDHFMIMDHAAEIPAGGIVEVTVELADGSVIELGDIPVRTMNAGDEDYGEDGALHGHAGQMESMDHGADQDN